MRNYLTKKTKQDVKNLFPHFISCKFLDRREKCQLAPPGAWSPLGDDIMHMMHLCITAKK